MNVLHRNLEAIRVRDPDLASRLVAAGTEGIQAEQARSGQITFRVKSLLEASAEDPEADAHEHAARFLRQAEQGGARRLVIFGLGVHTLRYLERFEGPVLVIEPSLELCRAVLEQIDLSAELRRMDLVVSDSPESSCRHPCFGAVERGVFVLHPTARRRAPELYEQLARRFHPGGTPGRLRILVIPPLYGGSLPVARACASAFHEIGHEAIEVNLEPFLGAYRELRALPGMIAPPKAESLATKLTRVVGDLVLAIVEEQEPDVAFALAQAPVDPLLVSEIRRTGAATAFWFCEDFRVMTYWKDLAPRFDTVFHVQPRDFSEPLRALGAHEVPLSMGFDAKVHRPIDLTSIERARYGSDLSFVGANRAPASGASTRSGGVCSPRERGGAARRRPHARGNRSERGPQDGHEPRTSRPADLRSGAGHAAPASPRLLARGRSAGRTGSQPVRTRA
ncbi:MAG: DUF3880 domain-containing protein [Myxococcota bacterium]